MFKQTLLVSAIALTLSACGTQIGFASAESGSNPNYVNPPSSDSEQNNSGDESKQPVVELPTQENSQLGNNQPDNNQPDNNQPDNNQPDNNDSGASQPVTTEPVNPSHPTTPSLPTNPTEPDNSVSPTNPVVTPVEQPENDNGTVTEPVNTLPEQNPGQPAEQPEVSEPSDTPVEVPSSVAQFVNGNRYAEGDRVLNQSVVYQCVVAGWCSVGALAYVPGEGYAWQNAWQLVDDVVNDNDENNTTEPKPTQPEPENNDTGLDNGSDNSNQPSNPEITPQPDLDLTGWPTALKEKNVAYQNSSNKVVASYFVEWGVYGRNYHVADIPAQNLTHILYGFIPICGPNESLTAGGPASALKQACASKQDYQVTIHDTYAALEKSYPGDKWDDPIKGNFGQLMRMKASNPHIKVLPSIGGWTLSDPFFDFDNAQNRATFVDSVKDFLVNYPLFDGVDIDWEFPGGGGANTSLGQASDSQTYVKLMRELRAMLDELETQTGRDLELSSAIGTSPRFIQAVDYANAAPYMDYIFMMTYDYKGAWSNETGHQTNLYASNMTADDSLSINIAVNEMLKQNVDPAKLVVGVAKYGRGWSNVTGAQPFAGTGGAALNESGYWEAGIMDYKLIESRYLGGDAEGDGINGWQHLYDDAAEAAYLWNADEKKLITFDSTRSVKAKSEYVVKHNLGGVFSWEIDADNGSILNAMHDGLGHPQQ